jgi:hypothetical protein
MRVPALRSRCLDMTSAGTHIPTPAHVARPVAPGNGVAPGGRWLDIRARDTKTVRWETLDSQLAGIHRRRHRVGVWEPDKAASQTMAAVRRQTMAISDTRGLDAVSLPAWARGRWKLIPNAALLLGLLWSVYRAGAGGLFDCAATIAAELGFSERTLRNLLYGRRLKGVTVAPGLVDLGLVQVITTWREGSDGRVSDQGHNLLRVGPAFCELADLVVWAKRKRPRRCSAPAQRVARSELARLRRESVRLRRDAATSAWEARPGRVSRAGGSSAVPAAPPVPVAANHSTMPATLADNPALGGTPSGFPPTGEGGTGGGPVPPQKCTRFARDVSARRPRRPVTHRLATHGQVAPVRRLECETQPDRDVDVPAQRAGETTPKPSPPCGALHPAVPAHPPPPAKADGEPCWDFRLTPDAAKNPDVRRMLARLWSPTEKKTREHERREHDHRDPADEKAGDKRQ